jgi:hypothetical protein
MRPSIQNSLLLAVGLAVAASSLGGMNPHELAAGTLPRLPRPAPGEMPPRLVLLPQAAAVPGGPQVTMLTRSITSSVSPAADPETARAAFRRRAERLVAERLARERHGTP